VAIEFDAQSGVTSGLISATVLSVVMSPEDDRVRPVEGPSIICYEPGLCDQFNDVRIYPSLRLVAILPHFGFRRGANRVTGMKLRAILTAMVIALTTPAFADISDYESMHRRLADALGSRAQADAAYDKLMKEAYTYGQPIASVVDLFIAVCTASGECNP
jgi:hypothetical protein